MIIRAVEKIPYKQIGELFDVAKSTISALLKRYRNLKTLENKQCSGRQDNCRTSIQNFAKTIKTRSPHKSAVELNGILSKNHSVKCSEDIKKVLPPSA